MQFTRCNPNLNICNVDETFVKNSQPLIHGMLLPSSIRCLIVGPSNCGKTNVMINLLEDPNGLRFKNVYIYSKSLHQPKYNYLRKIMTSVSGLGYFEFSDNADIIPPNYAKKNSIFIFDDVACSNQKVIREYFSMGRHNLVDSFFLCQSYTKILKHLLRDNANLLIIFKQDDINLKHIYDEHIGVDMSFKTFKKLCNECWKDKYGFLVVNKDKDFLNGRYCKMFKYNVNLNENLK